MKTALVIGGGIGGCVAAIELRRMNWQVKIVEASSDLGAGLRTRYIAGHPCTAGPRHFLTHNESVYQYLNKLVPLRLCKEHQFISFVEQDQSFYSYPIHIDDVSRMPESEQIAGELNELESGFRDRQYTLRDGTQFKEDEGIPSNYKEFWLRSIGPTLYNKFISSYTRKMWMVDDESVISDFTWSPKGVAIKRGPREGWDTAISAYPIATNGYDDVFLMAKDAAEVIYNTIVKDIDTEQNKVTIGGDTYKFDLIINSGPIDSVLDNRYGPLEYIGRDIIYFVLPIEFALPTNVYFSYYCGTEKYTRIVEYKKFTHHKSPHTLLSLEIPSKTGKYYPLPTKQQQDLAETYLRHTTETFHSIGRLGRYNYRFDIDDAIEQVLEITKGI
jgi:UDP-galactopyranose mutase